jgi:hypothetical protein
MRIVYTSRMDQWRTSIKHDSMMGKRKRIRGWARGKANSFSGGGASMRKQNRNKADEECNLLSAVEERDKEKKTLSLGRNKARATSRRVEFIKPPPAPFALVGYPPARLYWISRTPWTFHSPASMYTVVEKKRHFPFTS